MKWASLRYLVVFFIILRIAYGCAGTPPIIIQEFQKINQEAREIREKIKELVYKDPDSAMKDFIFELDRVLEYSERVKDNPKPGDVAAITEVVKTAEFNFRLEQALSRTVETDFDKGKYELSDLSGTAKNSVREFVEQLLAIKKEYGGKNPGQSLTIKIKIVGYTDQVGFRYGTELLKKLTEGVKDEVPENQPEQRQFLNQRLSFFRAGTLSEYIQQLLVELDQENLDIQIELEIEGRGEDIPPGVTPPYHRVDSRRRICKISATIGSKERGPQLFHPTTEPLSERRPKN